MKGTCSLCQGYPQSGTLTDHYLGAAYLSEGFFHRLHCAGGPMATGADVNKDDPNRDE